MKKLIRIKKEVVEGAIYLHYSNVEIDLCKPITSKKMFDEVVVDYIVLVGETNLDEDLALESDEANEIIRKYYR